ncbi:MAG: lipopolysaccharide heptosyltransferase II, partial [Bacteroidota bacterium]
MRPIKRILVIQTAFIGDVILTLPLVQALQGFFAQSAIDIVVVPRSADVCSNHPSISNVITFDKGGRARGVSGLVRTARELRNKGYDLAFVPHRSLRSAALAFLARIPLRVGFNRSAGRFLFTSTVRYDSDAHEIERNLSLLSAYGIEAPAKTLPHVYPGRAERDAVDGVLHSGAEFSTNLVAIAPGTVWNTKRWIKERFAALADLFLAEGYRVVLIGGKDDINLCKEIADMVGAGRVVNTAGKLTLLGSAELLGRCRLLVSNDSAPMHLAVAVGTPVVAIFGATVPEFGFSPAGVHDEVVEVRGLSCRPCSSHGGDKCPIKTFDCMLNIKPDRVMAKARIVLERAG